MNGILFYPSGDSRALTYAVRYLSQQGVDIASAPSPQVTHLLLPVPSFDTNGQIKGGGSLVHTLSQLPENVTVMGGNLQGLGLQSRKTVDFLQDPYYLAENAAITADCAIRIAGNNISTVFAGCPILIIGWGRIGKCLADKLKTMGADVSVAARKESDRAMLTALGYRVENLSQLMFSLVRYRAIFNTVPATVLTEGQTQHCRGDCVKIDLASQLGIMGKDVIWARGLPNQDAPEASGILIAKTAIRLAKQKEAVL